MMRTTTRLLGSVLGAAAGLVAFGQLAHAEEPPPLPEPVRQAVQRDLGMSPEAYQAASDRTATAGELSDRLARVPGFRNVSLDGDRVVVWGSGDELARAARQAGAELRAPSVTVDVPTLLGGFAQRVGSERLLGYEVATDGTVTLRVTGDPGVRGSKGTSPQDYARGVGAQIASGEMMRPQAGPATGDEGFVAYADWWPGARCTTGLAMIGPDGHQRMLTAGHCTVDGQFTKSYLVRDETVSMGTLELAQFGGPNNAAETPGDGTDLALFKGLAVDMLPEVTTYNGAPMKVTGSVRPVVGAPVCVGGSTMQEWRCATVTSIGGTFVQGGPNGDQRRWVNGFGFGLQSMVGDSGAPVMSGSRAMGILTAAATSAGSSYAADLGFVEAKGYRVERTPNAVLEGPIREKWLSLGGETGLLGPATGPQYCGLKDGGCWQQFTGGKIHWSPASGAYFSRGLVQDKWRDTGWENGPLGYPTSDEICGLKDGGCYQVFQGGKIHFSPATGAHFSRGLVQERWAELGWENGVLGYPVTDELCGLSDGGCWQGFQGGKIHFSPATGAQFTRGLIQERWAGLGWENGRMGYPSTGEMCGLVGGGCWQRFQDSKMYWSPGSGAHPVWGMIGQYWDANGYEHGRFGYPISGESCDANGCVQRFQRGTITWSPATGARG